MSGSDQKQNSPDIYDAIPRGPEPQQGYTMREYEQVNLGIWIQVEDISENVIDIEEPSIHDVNSFMHPVGGKSMYLSKR